MRVFFAALLAAALLLPGRPASAHRLDEYLQATVLSLEAHQLHASVRLVPGVAVATAVIDAIDRNHDGAFSDEEERAYAQDLLDRLSIVSDGQAVRPMLTSWSFPQPAQLRDGLGEIHLEYRAELAPRGLDGSLVLANLHPEPRSVYLINLLVPEDRDLHIVAQKRNRQQSIYEVDYRRMAGGPRFTWQTLNALLDGNRFSNLFPLGMRHIAEGTDHLLFLLTLLLPAPLLAIAGRWGPPVGVGRSLRRVAGIVTAFTVGHSITLTLAALGVVHVPGRPVEVLIAFSIFVSALHALRPIAPGREAVLAATFGLVHGLAFAATLDRLGLDPWSRMAGILAFNLGIEAMQMLVVLAVLPSLLLLSRTRAYPVFRVCGACVGAAAALGWMAERLFRVPLPVDGLANLIAQRAVPLAIALFLMSLACTLLPAPGTGPVRASSPQL